MAQQKQTVFNKLNWFYNVVTYGNHMLSYYTLTLTYLIIMHLAVSMHQNFLWQLQSRGGGWWEGEGGREGIIIVAFSSNVQISAHQIIQERSIYDVLKYMNNQLLYRRVGH